MIRALYVDVALVHLNPSATYFPHLMELAFPDLSFYGPGFSSPDELTRGLAKWIRETGPYEMIIIGPNSPILAGEPNEVLFRSTLAYMRRSTAHSHAESQIIEYLRDLFAVLPTVDIEHRIATSMNFDYYAATEAQVRRLHELNLTLIGPNAQFCRPLKELPEFTTQEKHYQRKKDRLSDCWFDFLQSHPERVITALHYVLPSEFSYTPILSRRPVVAVPGVEYHLRREAIVELRRSGVKRASKRYFHAFRILNRLGVPIYGTHWGLFAYHQLYLRTLRKSSYVYTARGAFGLPVRKFFEIPAAGALLLCSPCTGYEDLGFVNGTNYHAVEPKDLPSLLHELIRTGGGQDVATAGRKITATSHSLEARAEQIARCMDALVKGVYEGASWQQGEFVVRQRKRVDPWLPGIRLA